MAHHGRTPASILEAPRFVPPRPPAPRKATVRTSPP